MISSQTDECPPSVGALRYREDKVDAIWSADEDERRIAFARRAAAGARKALAARPA